ncbi:MAG: hypothetical protein AAFR81_08645 [Chloroflexota bacterium]
MRKPKAKRKHADNLANPFMALLDFTEDDLKANRKGYMTDYQEYLLIEHKKQWRYKLLFLLFSFELLLGAPVVSVMFMPDLVLSMPSSFLGFVIMMMLLVAAIWVTWYGNQNQKYERAKLENVTGKITKRKEGTIHIGDTELTFHQEQLHLLHRFALDQPYTIYYLSEINYVVSVELLFDNVEYLKLKNTPAQGYVDLGSVLDMMQGDQYTIEEKSDAPS